MIETMRITYSIMMGQCSDLICQRLKSSNNFGDIASKGAVNYLTASQPQHVIKIINIIYLIEMESLNQIMNQNDDLSVNSFILTFQLQSGHIQKHVHSPLVFEFLLDLTLCPGHIHFTGCF
jgi:hypothetical protein